MISLDTELMKTLVEGCVAANNNIEDAVAALAGITSHRDWGCKEKTRIDEYTDTNKNKIKQLQECSGNFLSVLRQVTHDFEETEKSIIDMASDVDVTIGTAIGITPAQKPVTGTLGQNTDVYNERNRIEQEMEEAMADIRASLGTVGDSKIAQYVGKTLFENIVPTVFSSILL